MAKRGAECITSSSSFEPFRGPKVRKTISEVVALEIARERSSALSLCKTASVTVERSAGLDDEPGGERPWDDLECEQSDEGVEGSSGDQEDEGFLSCEEGTDGPSVIVEPAVPMYTSELSTEALTNLLELEEMGLMVAWPKGVDAIVAKSVILSREA